MSHYLQQWWLDYQHIYVSFRLNELATSNQSNQKYLITLIRTVHLWLSARQQYLHWNALELLQSCTTKPLIYFWSFDHIDSTLLLPTHYRHCESANELVHGKSNNNSKTHKKMKNLEHNNSYFYIYHVCDVLVLLCTRTGLQSWPPKCATKVKSI